MATNDKYDRQLRLWGASGQRALAETCVVLIRATAAGTETVKNLVLPGIGAVHVVDDVSSSEEASSWHDAASNFFVTTQTTNSSTTSSSSSSRAEMALTLLRELNPDVQGSWHHSSTVPLLDLDWSAVLHDVGTRWERKQRLLVIGSDLEPPLLGRVAAACADQNVPLVAVHAYGLMGVVRLQTPPLALLEPRRTAAPPDLRLMHPFPRFVTLANEIMGPADSSTTWPTTTSGRFSDYEHGHLPYPLILYRLAQDWKVQHQGQLPQTATEKQEFQATIRAAARHYDRHVNFQEAVQYAYLAYTAPPLDPERVSQLQHQAAAADCPVLDLLLRALQQFVVNTQGQLPLNDSLPDMTSSTDWYVRLQTVYCEQAADDVQEMKRLVQVLQQQQQQQQQQLQLQTNHNSMESPSTSTTTNNKTSSSAAASVMVTDEQVTLFCKNVLAVDLFQTRSIVDEYNNHQVTDELCEEWQSAAVEASDEERPDQVPLLWYLGFRACQAFFVQHGRYPGTVWDSENEAKSLAKDAALLQQCLVDVVAAYRLSDNELIQSTLLAAQEEEDNDTVELPLEDHIHGSSTYSSKYAVELTRYGNAELHTIASVVGGVASQEAVKIVTGQYVPIRNTYIYNGIASTGAVYQF